MIEGSPQYATVRAVEETVLYRMSMHELLESAGGPGLPAAIVLKGLAHKLRLAADQLVRSGQPLDLGL